MSDLGNLVLLAFISLGLVAPTAAALQAPEGYEDETGFHFAQTVVSWFEKKKSRAESVKDLNSQLTRTRIKGQTASQTRATTRALC